MSNINYIFKIKLSAGHNDDYESPVQKAGIYSDSSAG